MLVGQSLEDADGTNIGRALGAPRDLSADLLQRKANASDHY